MKKTILVLSIAVLLFSCNKEVTFSAPSEVTTGSNVNIKFSKPVSSTEGDQCWICIVEEGSPAGTWGVWKYVDNNATSDVLVAPATPGNYEIRMYDSYPKKENHLTDFHKLVIK